MQDCVRRSVHAGLQDKENIQATLVNSCLAKLCIWLLGKGTNMLAFRKSKTLCPSKSVTMHM